MIKYIECLWDYDGVLFEYDDEKDEYTNCFTRNKFKTYKQYPECWLAYQFNSDWELNWLSQFNAKWLNKDDDLSLIENRMWWSIELENNIRIFNSLKNLSIPHIKNILESQRNLNPEYRDYFNKRIEWVIDYQSDTQNELLE